MGKLVCLFTNFPIHIKIRWETENPNIKIKKINTVSGFKFN